MTGRDRTDKIRWQEFEQQRLKRSRSKTCNSACSSELNVLKMFFLCGVLAVLDCVMKKI